MKTKEELLLEFRNNFPTIKVGSEELGYTFLESEEYEATINVWADDVLLKQEAEALVTQNATDKAALLTRLGLTADEFKTLLGGN